MYIYKQKEKHLFLSVIINLFQVIKLFLVISLFLVVKTIIICVIKILIWVFSYCHIRTPKLKF